MSAVEKIWTGFLYAVGAAILIGIVVVIATVILGLIAGLVSLGL